MPGIATLGKLFFRKFLKDLAGASRASTVSFTAGGAETLSAPREAGGKGASLVSLRPRLRLASHVASPQENNPAEMVATAPRTRHALPG